MDPERSGYACNPYPRDPIQKEPGQVGNPDPDPSPAPAPAGRRRRQRRRARLGGNYARTCARARRCWRRRRPAGRRQHRAGPGTGTGRVSRVWVARSIPAPLSGSEPPCQRLSVNRRSSWAVAATEPNRCNGSDRTVATVGWIRTEIPLPAINSAPFSQIKTH